MSKIIDTISLPTILNKVKSFIEKKISESSNNDNILYSSIYINQATSNPNLIISGDIRGKAILAIRNNSHRYVGAYLSTDKKYLLCLLDDTDSTKFYDGTDATSFILNYPNNVFMRLPEFYTKAIPLNNDKWQIIFAYGSNPGEEWTKWGGNDLIGVYKSSWTTNHYRSLSDKVPLVNYSLEYMAVGAGAENCRLILYRHQNIMAFLFYAWYGTTNIKETCGTGLSSYPTTTGKTNSLGMTDTTSVNNSGSTNFWGLENWYGDIWEWMSNVTVTNGVVSIVDAESKVRETQATISGFVYPTKFSIGDLLDTINISSGSSVETEGYCCASHIESGSNLVVRRGGYSNATICGLASVEIAYPSSAKGVDTGSRLTYTGDIEITTNISYYQEITGQV